VSTQAAKLFDKLLPENKFPHQELWPIVGDRAAHEAKCDDRCGIMTVMAGPDADMHIFLKEGDSDCHFGPPAVRIRTFNGGGRRERVRRALMILALAIEADSP
jgi:hypothetical protein